MQDPVKCEAINMTIASEDSNSYVKRERELQPMAKNSQHRGFLLKDSDVHADYTWTYRLETASPHPEVAVTSRHSGAHVMFNLHSLTGGRQSNQGLMGRC